MGTWGTAEKARVCWVVSASGGLFVEPNVARLPGATQHLLLVDSSLDCTRMSHLHTYPYHKQLGCSEEGVACGSSPC